MKELVIQSRITPPRQPVNIISRGSLLKTLSENSDKKIILVTGPAGYGKTTLACEYLYSTNAMFAWLHISRDISSPYTFLEYVIHSAARLNPDFGKKILETINSLKNESQSLQVSEPTIDEIVYRVCNEFASSFSENIFLILDDLHELAEQKWPAYLLNKLIAELPSNLKLIVTSRHLPDFNISHLRAKREILEIKYRDLVLSGNEIKTLASRIYSREFSAEEALRLGQTLGGWVTGVHLLIQATEQGINDNIHLEKFLPENVFDYFADEIFSKLPPDIQDFLLFTSSLENFTPELCDYITGKNNSAEILDFLAGKNIFIEAIQSVEPAGKLVSQYNYFQLFRNFLLNKSRTLLDGNILSGIYRKISAYYCNNGDIENSIEFTLLAGDIDEFLKILESGLDTLIEDGKFEKLWKWLNYPDKDFVMQNGFLQFAAGKVSKYYIGDLNKALEYIERSLSLLNESDNKTLYAKVLITKTGLLLDQGKFNTAIEILNELESRENSVYDKASILFNLGYAYFFIGNYAKAVPLLEKSSEISRDNNFEELLADNYNTLGNIYITNGEFVLSRHYYELALAKIHRIFKKIAILGNLTILYSRSAQFNKAREYYERTYEMYRLVKTPVFDILIKLTEYTLYFESGDFENALKIAAELNSSSIKTNNIKYSYLSCLLVGDCNYYLGRYEIAEQYYSLAGKYIDDENENDKASLRMFSYANRMAAGKYSNDETVLDEVYNYFGETNSNYDKAICGFYAAKFYLITGSAETAARFLNETLSLAKDKEYNSFLMREYLNSKEIFNFASAKNISKPLVNLIISIIRDLPHLSWLKPDYSEKLAEKLSNIYDIRMLAFGKLHFYVNGKEIDDKKWIRKKRKAILAYLFLSAGHSATKDKIIDIFFPDTPAESLDNTFHQAISNLRSALKDDDAPKTRTKVKDKTNTGPEYILYEDKILRLNPVYHYHCDVTEFDKLLNKGNSPETTKHEKISLLKNAVDLYKGDLLEEYYEPWAEDARDEYRNKFIKAAELLLDLFNEENKHEEIINCAAKLLTFDKLNEKAYLLSVGSFTSLGKRSSAKSLYEKMLKQYNELLGEKPAKDIINKISAIIS